MVEITQKDFFNDVVKLASGTVISQIIGVATIPVLARVYPPESFGISAIFSSISGIISVVACMRYEFAIVLPKSEKEAAALLKISLGFTLLTSLATLAVSLWISQLKYLTQDHSEILCILWLLPISVSTLGCSAALSNWSSRFKKFTRLSISQVITALTSATIATGFGLADHISGSAMVVASVIGQLFAVVFLGTATWIEHRHLLLSVRRENCLELIHRYRRFPMYGIWSALLTTTSWQLPTFLLATFFSPRVVGYYSLGFRVLKLPINLLGKSISQVFFQRAAESRVKGGLSTLVETTFIKLVDIGFFPIFMLSIVGRDLFTVCFGTEWAEAGTYTQILSIWSFFWFVSGPFSTLYSVLEKQNLQLRWNLFNFASRLAALAIGGLFNDPKIALILFSLSGVLVYGEKILMNFRLAKVNIRSSQKRLTTHACNFIPVIFLFFGLFYIEIEGHIKVLIAVILTICNFLWLTKKEKSAD